MDLECGESSVEHSTKPVVGTWLDRACSAVVIVLRLVPEVQDTQCMLHALFMLNEAKTLGTWLGGVVNSQFRDRHLAHACP